MAVEVPIYVINLDRATGRLASISANLAEHGQDFIRVPAVDGRALAPDAVVPVDIEAFKQLNSRDILPGEIGCYMSHLDAFDLIQQQAAPFALILEDDVEITADFMPTVQELAARDDWDVVKLANHRVKMFKPFFTLPSGRRVGRCLHGPYGSSAAYIVRTSAVPALARGLTPMTLPYDTALEAAWRYHLRFFVMEKDLAVVDRADSMIGDRSHYRAVRYSFWKRLGAFSHRNSEILSRARYFWSKT
jgi:glycosyl transferase family 25